MIICATITETQAMNDRLYNDTINSLRDYRAHLRGETTLRATTLSSDTTPKPAEPETAWYSINGEGGGLTAQSFREIAEGSRLAMAGLIPVLRRFDRDDTVFYDDIIFYLRAGAKKTGYARIYLTYGEQRRKYSRLPRLLPIPEAAAGAP